MKARAVCGNEVIVYYDEHCRLCQATVRFLLAHQRPGQVRCEPLQSTSGQDIARRAGLDPEAPGSLVVCDQNHTLYTRSTAALRVARHLRFPWSLIAICRILPQPVRDAFYDGIARNRYRWFGKKS